LTFFLDVFDRHLQSDIRNWERHNWTADGQAEVAASATIITKETSMASIVDDLLDEGTPRMNITVETAESVYLIQSSAWRSGRTQWPQTPAEKAAEKIEYYKAYDPLTGLKIAATLSGFLTMAVLYVFYKVCDITGVPGALNVWRAADFCVWRVSDVSPSFPAAAGWRPH
jgi:hypothetical protein